MIIGMSNPGRRGVYLLPNLLTTGNLFAGFYAIVAGMSDNFTLAAAAIFVAMVMDALDGRVARLTNTQTLFGAQYDSLADIVAFGLAPALVAYSWLMHDLGKIGWSVTFLYVTTAALRLARFNVQHGVADRRYFVGLPSPAAAGVIASFIYFIHSMEIKGTWIAFLLAVLIATVSGLMVSNIYFYSFKEINLQGRVSFLMIWLVALVIAAISFDPPVTLFIVFLSYALSGPGSALRRWYLRRRRPAT